MPINHLEQLIAEWYEYQGYFIRRNVRVGKRKAGGFEGELDVIAFNPEQHHLVHIECSTDASSWAQREKKYKRKFEVGRKYVPDLFKGMAIPEHIEQIAVLVFGSSGNRKTLGGGAILMAEELVQSIMQHLAKKTIAAAFVPEQFTILRGLHLASAYRHSIMKVWQAVDGQKSSWLS